MQSFLRSETVPGGKRNERGAVPEGAVPQLAPEGSRGVPDLEGSTREQERRHPEEAGKIPERDPLRHREAPMSWEEKARSTPRGKVGKAKALFGGGLRAMHEHMKVASKRKRARGG